MNEACIQACLQQVSNQLGSSCDSPRLDAERLLMHVLQKPHSYLFSHPDHPLSDAKLNQLQTLVQRRQQGEPLAYLLGSWGFWDFDVEVNAHTLIPRPETECVIQWVCDHFQQADWQVADIGTGSGSIALALARERPSWKITASDICSHALATAKRNAGTLQLNHIHFKQSDLFTTFAKQRFHLIVSNPPYIAEDDTHLEALRYEPTSALCAGEDGLTVIRRLIAEATSHLHPNGYLVLEHGFEQHLAVQSLLKNHGFCDVSSHRDLSGNWRFSCARLPNSFSN